MMSLGVYQKIIKDIYICSNMPENFGDIAHNELGYSENIKSRFLPEENRLVIDAITDGKIDKSGIAKYWVLVNGNEILFTHTLNTPTKVTQGNSFTLSEFDISFDISQWTRRTLDLLYCNHCNTYAKEDIYHSGTCENCGAPFELKEIL